MRVEVGAVLVGPGAVAVAQVARHLPTRPAAHLVEGGVDAGLGGVRLGREREVGRRLGEVDAALGHADDLGGAEGGVRDQQRLRVRVADVLGGADHDAARDELGVLARVEHAGEPVERRVRVAPAHRLDERGDDVVVHVAGLVVGEPTARVGLEHVLGGDEERRAVALPLARGVDHLARELERGERGAAVAAGERHDLVLRLGRERKAAREAALVGEGPPDELAERVVVERLELHHAAAADERGVDLEVGVLGRCPDEHDRAVLHRVQQRVLLAAVEAVYLVDEEDGAPTEREQAAPGGLDLAAQVLDRSRDGADLDELGVRGARDDARERRLARARRAVEDDRRERVVLDGAPQPRPRADGLRLTDEALERGGAHAGGERRVLVSAGVLNVREEGVHGMRLYASGPGRHQPPGKPELVATASGNRPLRLAASVSCSECTKLLGAVQKVLIHYHV